MDQHEANVSGAAAFTASEIAGIGEAATQADQGLLVEFAAVSAWLASLDTEHPLPRPEFAPARRAKGQTKLRARHS